nr:ParA family protein [Sulfolobus sp. E11-6]
MATNIVRVLSIKGGVGKTSIAYALARTISSSGYKVLLLDMDNLHTISRVLGVKNCELTYVKIFSYLHVTISVKFRLAIMSM